MTTPLKYTIGFVLSFVPSIYCAYVVYYLINTSGSLQDAENNGLGPTLLGLTIVGLLSCIPLVVKVVLVFIELRRPKLRVGGGGDDDRGRFDADAVVARYLAQRSSQAESSEQGGAVSSLSFGRKNTQ
jgi:hypothetical protein